MVCTRRDTVYTSFLSDLNINTFLFSVTLTLYIHHLRSWFTQNTQKIFVWGTIVYLGCSKDLDWDIYTFSQRLWPCSNDYSHDVTQNFIVKYWEHYLCYKVITLNGISSGDFHLNQTTWVMFLKHAFSDYIKDICFQYGHTNYIVSTIGVISHPFSSLKWPFLTNK